jgi:hypothetical protein
MNPTAISQNKEWRRNLDNILQRIKSDTHPDCPHEWARSSRERTIAIMKLQEAIMWLGMDLKAINEEAPSPDTASPYPSSYDPESTTIEPTADGLKL